MFREVKKSFRKLSLLLLIVTAAFLLWGCGGGGGSSYTPPVETSTDTPLIDVATLKGWMDDGLVNSGTTGIDNVVILYVGAATEDRIPGSYVWADGEIRTTRLDGLTEVGSLVCTGEAIDAVLQRSGVNEYTTIVVTGNRVYDESLGYFTLRYWGFPKERIKVLDGYTAAWDAAYGNLIAESPADVTGNTFSVGNNGQLNDDLHYSIGEYILANDANIASNDADGTYEYNLLPNGSNFYVAASAIKTAADETIGGSGDYYAAGDDGISYYKSAEDMQAVLDNYEAKFDSENMTIVNCGSGLSASPMFFALDAILNLPVALFDGSRTQWYQYRGCPVDPATTLTDYVANFDCPEIGDGWNVAMNGRSYNPVDTVAEVSADVNPGLNMLYPSPSYPETNQVENADNDYMSQSAPPSTGDGAPVAGGEVGDGC